MRDLDSVGLRHRGGALLVLDQQKLPEEEVWLGCSHPDEMVAMIKSLRIRGAPLIGVGAALALAKFAEGGASAREIREAAARLHAARPTAVNLMAAVDRVMIAGGITAASEFGPVKREGLIAEAERIFEEDVELCRRMGEHGARLVRDGESLLTHCNAGALATAGIGTAIGVITTAHRQGKRVHVYVDETRPLLQGARLTAWELGRAGVPYTLICDNMAAGLMRDGRVQRVFTGADRIALNGDFANKIGTYGVATLASFHGVPFHPVAPYTTVDFSCPTGREIPIEERDPGEVRGAKFRTSGAALEWSPKDARVFNPAFDVTPVALVESLVLDSGVVSRKELQSEYLEKLRKERS